MRHISQGSYHLAEDIDTKAWTFDAMSHAIYEEKENIHDGMEE